MTVALPSLGRKPRDCRFDEVPPALERNKRRYVLGWSTARETGVLESI